jgi:hypothetical protein
MWLIFTNDELASDTKIGHDVMRLLSFYERASFNKQVILIFILDSIHCK